ncbi:MAG: PH domain-containing protein [Thermoplasmata archaeon]
MISLTPIVPRHFKAAYLAQEERLLAETRGTALFYLPKPIAASILFGILAYAAAAVRPGWPGVPYLTPLFARGPVLFGIGPGTYLLIPFLLLLLASLLWLLYRYVRWISTVYAVTTTRVALQHGIFSRSFEEMPLLQLRSVDVHQSVGQRILRYGTIRVSSESGASLGNQDWQGVPHPFRFQKVIEDARARLLAGTPATPTVAPPTVPTSLEPAPSDRPDLPPAKKI